MNEGDELLALIRQAVSQHPFPAQQQEMVVEIVGRSVITVMTNPHFLHRLVIVQQLQHENNALRQRILQLEAFIRLQGTAKPPPKKRPAKKAAAKKTVARSPKVQVRGSTASNRRAFKQGYRGA